MKYKLFISDFDGTLVRDDGTVSNENIQAIEEYRKRGGKFAICTGRMLAAIRPRLKELGLTEGIVFAFQGIQAADIKTGRLLKDFHYPQEEIVEILRFMEAHGLHIHIYAGEELITNYRDGYLEHYEKLCRVKARVVFDMPLSDMVVREKLHIVKTLAMVSAEEQPSILRLLLERFEKDYYVVGSSAYLVEILPKGQNKGNAVQMLSEYYGVKPEEIAAIGDQENDIPMVAAAGGKFAVANAVEKLKEIATVVPSYEENGVAYALRHYAMGEKE